MPQAMIHSIGRLASLLRCEFPSRSWRRAVAVLIGAAGLAVSAVQAQEFLPPEPDDQPSPVWFGLAGFGTRVGMEVSWDRQGVIGFTLDVGDLGSPRVRLRPSFDVGFAGDVNTYVGNLEVLYRFTADTETAVPYIGGGLGIFGQSACGETEGCPALWLQFALGFEMRLAQSINWLIEYHPEDLFSRHVILLGLTMRRGN